MKKTLLLIAAWLLAACSLYAGVLLLDCYWNLVNWRPRCDWESGSLLVWIIATLVGIRRLVKADGRAGLPVAQCISLLLSLMLLSLGVYVLPAEPLGQGWLGREASSPLWYRATRLLVLALPGVFWGLARWQSPNRRA